MDIKPLEIKNKTNYDWDDIIYINDFDVNSLETIKRKSRIGANIYHAGYVLNSDYDCDTINPLYLVISRLTGYVEKTEGSSDKYLVVAKSLRNKDIFSVLDTVWGSIKNEIEDKVNSIPNNYPNIKIKDYDKFRFNSNIDLPLDTSIEFRSLVINVSCVIEKDNEYYPEIYLDECLYVKGNIWRRTYKMIKVRELKIDSTLWTTPSKIINLLDFKPEKLSIETKNNSNNNIKVPHVRYENGGFYLTIDNIRGYFSFSNNLGTLIMIFANDDQQNKYHQVWKEILKIINGGNGELKLHEKIRLFDVDLPIEHVFKIPSITIVIKSLIEKSNKFYLELSLNHCLYEI